MNLKKYLGKYLGGFAAALLLCAANSAMAGFISGSAHDFSTLPGNTSKGICIACHTPHKADVGTVDAPLWNHANTTATYTFYGSSTMNAAAPSGVSGVSKLCLSCHDGTVAIDSFGGATGSTKITAAAYKAGSNIGVSLSDDHPIGIQYDAALATADGSLHNPASKTVTIGSGAQSKTGTIQNTMLYGPGKNLMECSSCHDVHNTFTPAVAEAGLLKVTQNGSQICLACHNK
jgi:predicted CXXCH cytochrome family protein